MKHDLRRAFAAEIASARSAFRSGELDAAFRHLERTHVLGQRHTGPHVLAHWWMLRVGLRRRDSREIVGQILRISAAALFSRIWVPRGNTGGAKVSAFKPMPVPEDLRKWMED